MSRSCFGRKDMFFLERSDYEIMERLDPTDRLAFLNIICEHYLEGKPFPKNYRKNYKIKAGMEV